MDKEKTFVTMCSLPVTCSKSPVDFANYWKRRFPLSRENRNESFEISKWCSLTHAESPASTGRDKPPQRSAEGDPAALLPRETRNVADARLWRAMATARGLRNLEVQGLSDDSLHASA